MLDFVATNRPDRRRGGQEFSFNARANEKNTQDTVHGEHKQRSDVLEDAMMPLNLRNTVRNFDRRLVKHRRPP